MVLQFFRSFLLVYWLGIKDSLRFTTTLKFFYRSPLIRALSFKCFVLNGLLFLGTMLLVDYIILPFGRYVFGESLASQSFETVFSVFYYILWVWPMYIISYIMSAVYFQDIADEAFRMRFGDRFRRKVAGRNIFEVISDAVYGLVLFIVYMAALQVVGAVLTHLLHAYVALVFKFFGVAWFYAYYAVEFRWINEGRGLPERLQLLENSWAYYAGLGSWISLLGYIFPFFVSSGLFAILFPFILVTAVIARPPRATELGSLPIFWLSCEVTDRTLLPLLNHFMRR